MSAAVTVATLVDRAPQPVILIVADRSRCEQVRSLMQLVAPHCWTLMAGSTGDAAVRLVAGCIDLVLLDLECEAEQPLALIHLLARLSPASRLLAFALSASSLPIHPYEVHPWCDAEALLRLELGGGHGRRWASSAPLSASGAAA